MLAAEDKDPICALAADRADPTFGDGIRTRGANRRANALYLFRGEHGIETGDELAIAIADQET